MKILYLYTQTRLTDIKPHVYLGIMRLSNYLNSRKHELNELIEEEYLDLGFGDLPKFTPENLETYRKKLKMILLKYHKRYPFDLLAISCFTSLNYMNSVEIAYLIKEEIKLSCLIVVGGIHPSICPEDFQLGNFPDFLYKKYSENINPFDYLIKDEGELPFFNLVKGLIKDTVERRSSLEDKCIILESHTIEDLDQLPIIDFDLFEKYLLTLNKEVNFPRFSLDLSRGCPFRCSFCYNSGKALEHYKRVRLKSIEKIIKELDVIKNTKWLDIKDLFITDMIFLPKKSKRNLFFEELNKYYKNKGVLPFNLLIMDRIAICSKKDLQNYKSLNITPLLGLESCSKTLLSRTGKFFGKNEEDKKRAINNHLLKFEEIIRISNKIGLNIAFFYIIGLPGTTKNTFKENRDFLFKPKLNGKSLIEQYKINLLYNKYSIYKNTEFYDCCEDKFGSLIYYKEWWKKFDEYYHYYPALVDPSSKFTLIKSISKNLRLFRKIYKIQQKLGNSYYKEDNFNDDDKAAQAVFYLIERRKREQISGN